MERKIKKLEKFMTVIGITQEEVVAYWKGREQKNCCEKLPIINSNFSEGDVRSQTKLLWYAFEGKKFSPDPNAYPNCQGVVGWINSVLNAPEGERIYVVLPEQMCLPYSNKYCQTGADDLYDGRANTLKLIEYGKKHNVRFPAVEYAYNYTKNGVKQGEAFLPARNQLRRVYANRGNIKKALELIGGTFKDWLLSSSEHNDNCAWYMYSDGGYIGWDRKTIHYSVSCFLAY